MSKWIRKGDKVVVVSGNDKGKVGDVISRKEHRVIVQGINIRKKHVKRQQKAPGAGVIEMEMPLNISKIAHCNADGKAVKAKVRVSDSGVKEIYYLEGAKQVVLRQVKKTS
jgi:large subunit ribosomal protein L24